MLCGRQQRQGEVQTAEACLLSNQATTCPIARPSPPSTPHPAVVVLLAVGCRSLTPLQQPRQQPHQHHHQPPLLQPAGSRAQQPCQRSRRLRAGPIDAAPAWTLDQLAGLAFGVCARARARCTPACLPGPSVPCLVDLDCGRAGWLPAMRHTHAQLPTPRSRAHHIYPP